MTLSALIVNPKPATAEGNAPRLHHFSMCGPSTVWTQLFGLPIMTKYLREIGSKESQ